VSLLESVVAGTLDASTALEQWPNIDSETDDLLVASWHDLAHLAADKDIRERDPGYATYQKDLLLDRAKKIKETDQLRTTDPGH
jgi:hypothetical protein